MKFRHWLPLRDDMGPNHSLFRGDTGDMLHPPEEVLE